ncbi:MAG: DMT family transporter, partial [Clostridia bacterium]|nr:DMT family transporter [Clostridia bacterium]
MSNRKYLAPLFLAFLCWGSLYVVSKIAMKTIPPVTLLEIRYLIAAPTLFLLLKLRGALRPLKKEHMGTVFAIGFTGYFASFCLQMLGINRLTGSVSSLLGAMNPIFIPILAAVFLKEQLTVRKILCVAVSMTGVV